MSTTRIMPLHTGKGQDMGKAISDILDYVGTHKRRTTVGSSPAMSATAALPTQNFFSQKSGTQSADDVIAYHLRQSFLSGEVTPEETNRMDLASRMLCWIVVRQRYGITVLSICLLVLSL